MIILGGGMAGCIAGHVFKDAVILEANQTPTVNHHALLRFKTDKVSLATGIPFKKVKIQKSIWYNGCEVQPSPRMTMLYSKKVIGEFRRRSITDIKDEIRYIAPDNFHMMMIDQLGGRIGFGRIVRSITKSSVMCQDKSLYHRKDCEPVVSTIPMTAMSKVANTEHCPVIKSNYRPIYATRVRIRHCDAYATVYFPGSETSVYRASLTGMNLIIESMQPIDVELDVKYVLNSLGMDGCQRDLKLSSEANIKHDIGKIQPVDEGSRRIFIRNLTADLNVYSLGRFAVWRNIMLDDVVDDISIIQRLMSVDQYELIRKGARHES